MVEVAFTVNRDTHEPEFMATATKEEWSDIMGDLDGVGHSLATRNLLAELKRWGVYKHYGCC